MSTLIATNLKHASSSSNNLVLNSDGSVTGAGKILQVVMEHRTDTWSESNAAGAKSGAAITKAITTAASNNKVLVTVSLMIGWDDQVNRTSVTLKRGGSEIALSDDTSDNKIRTNICGIYGNSNDFEPITFSYLDSPGSAASHSYTVHLNHGTTTTQTAYLNRAGTESNHSYRMRGTSSIILQEVSG
jgi:hypothetical protein